MAGTAVNVTSLSNTEAQFDAPSTSGSVVVDTDYGQAQAATSLTVVPSAIVATDVVDVAAVTPGGASTSLSIGQVNKSAVLEFDAEQGDRLALRIVSLTTVPSGAGVQYELYSPTGVSLQSGSISGGQVISARCCAAHPLRHREGRCRE